MPEEFKLGPTALVAIMKTLQDAILEGKDASQGLRDLRFEKSETQEGQTTTLEAKKA